VENSNSSWYKVKEISKKVWLIGDVGVNAYLIEGNEKALLVDTAWGIGNLSALVASLTSLPIIVVNTHGHPDHVSGNYHFEQAYLHNDDLPIMKKSFNPEARSRIIKRFSNNPLSPHFSEETWINAIPSKMIPLSENQQFELGGKTVIVIEIPGHTPGSICLLDVRDRLLFTADSVSEGNILLHFEYSLPLRTYLKGINHLISMNDKFDYIIPSHGNAPIDPAILLEFKGRVEKVITGELRGTPHETSLGNGLLCRFNSCGILYREENI